MPSTHASAHKELSHMAVETSTKRKRYNGYRSFQYLEAGVDYREFKLVREVH